MHEKDDLFCDAFVLRCLLSGASVRASELLWRGQGLFQQGHLFVVSLLGTTNTWGKFGLAVCIDSEIV